MASIKKAGVVGFPVAHSLSPRLHGFWLEKYDIAGEYKHYEVRPEELPKFIDKLRSDKDFVGVNLTIPHKEAVMGLLDEVDELAKEIGAVNTINNNNGILTGKNTDAYGFAENIRNYVTRTNKAVVLGAGGAAKAVVFALKELGFKHIVIANRSQERAEELTSVVSYPLSVADWKKRNEILKDANILINTTSLGMTGKEPLEIDLSLLPITALVTDIVYNPLITSLLVKASERGNPTVDGLGMLLHQAVPAFEVWFGINPEVTEELRQYVLAGIKS